jgi:dephospho-CoA kinase
MSKKTLICIVGMPASGKTLVAHYIAELGDYPIITMGDIVRELARERGIQDLRELMFKIREEEGRSAIAKRCIRKIEEGRSDVVIVDGIRNIEELEEFKKSYVVHTLAILCSQEKRFERLHKRKREDDPKLWDGFVKRDLAEKRIGIEEAILSAEYVITNEGTKEELKSDVQKVARAILYE